MNRILLMTLLGLTLFALPAFAGEQTVISKDTVWSGEVTISEDVLVLADVVLTVQSGTKVTIKPSESTQTQPEFFFPLTEITVRGTLNINGTADSPVTFAVPDAGDDMEWAGIVVDGGALSFSHASLSGAAAW